MLDPTNPNYKASIPVKILDAMASGRPVVTSEGLDMAARVKEAGCGFVIPYDAQAFRKTVLEAAKTPKLLDEMGAKGRAYYDRFLSWEHSSEELLAVYRALAGPT
jgi:glycosyltransferase involved in cell wall biosynthesis